MTLQEQQKQGDAESLTGQDRCMPCTWHKSWGMMKTWSTGEPAGRSCEKGQPHHRVQQEMDCTESLSTSPGMTSSGLAQPREDELKGERCQGWPLAELGDSLPGRTKAEQGYEPCPRRAGRSEQHLNNSTGKGTKKHKLARTKSGWQLPDSSSASRQKMVAELPAGMPELSWSGGGESCKNRSVCPSATFLPDKGVGEAIGWVSRNLVLSARVVPCRAGAHGSAAVLCSLILLRG